MTEQTLTYTDEAMQAIATIHSGIPRALLTLLAGSGRMRSATELQVRIGETQSETIRALRWLGEWGLVTGIPHDDGDVAVVRYSLTNSGALVHSLLPTLDA